MNPRRVRHENAHCSIYLQKQNTGTNINTHGQKKKKMASSIFIEPLGRARRYAIPQDECGSPREVSTEAMLFCFCLSIFNHQCPLLSGSPVFTSWKTGNHPTPSCLDVIHVLPTDVFAWDLKAEGRKEDPSFLSSTNSGHESFVGREVFAKPSKALAHRPPGCCGAAETIHSIFWHFCDLCSERCFLSEALKASSESES